MKFCCIICSEDIEANVTVSATTCGHLFHHECLFQWFQRHKSCPQCRKSIRLDKDVIKKLYFEPGPDGHSDEDTVEALKNKNKQLETELSMAISDSYRYIVDLSDSRSQNMELKSKLKDAEKTSRALQETLDSTSVQLSFLSNKAELHNDSKRQITQLKAKLNEYETSLNQANLENNQLKVRIENLRSDSKRVKRDHQKELENMSKKTSKVTSIRCFDITEITNKVTSIGPSSTVSKSISPNAVGEVAKAANGDGYKMEMNGKENERPPKLKTSKAAGCLGLKEHHSAVPANQPAPVDSLEELDIKKRRLTENKGLQRTTSMHGGYDEMGGHTKPDMFPAGKRLR